tara:strand:+ start:455 stop:730 length:276 start_codon:yes stop_codon:yes gene_type:complete
MNTMNVKNTKYCVTKILKSLPNFDLKNGSVGLEYLFLRIVNTTRKIPWKTPQITKFHDAPCHKPITTMESSKLGNAIELNRRCFKARGKYR